MSGLTCLATIGLLIQAFVLSALGGDPTPPEVDFIVIDDFESYTDEFGNRVFEAWIDGWAIDDWGEYCPGSGTNATVGYMYPPFAEQEIVHDGKQSMPLEYQNSVSACKATHATQRIPRPIVSLCCYVVPPSRRPANSERMASAAH